MRLSGPSRARRKTRRRMHQCVLRERVAGVQCCMSFQERVECVISQYVDYYNLSDMVLKTSIDESVQAVAEEMAWKMSQSLNTMIAL